MGLLRSIIGQAYLRDHHADNKWLGATGRDKHGARSS